MTRIAHYPMNKLSGGLVPDISGSGFHGTPTDVSLVTSKPGLGQAASFNGGTSRILTSITQAAASRTFCIWCKATSEADTYRFLLDSQTGRVVFLWRGSDDTMSPYSFLAYFDAGSWRTFGSTPTDGVFHHVAFVCDADAGTVTCFLDAVQSGTPQIYTPTALGGITAIGGRYTIATTTITFAGLLDDARIYDVVLPVWKVEEIYNHGRGSEECEPWQRTIRRTIRPAVQHLIGVG